MEPRSTGEAEPAQAPGPTAPHRNFQAVALSHRVHCVMVQVLVRTAPQRATSAWARRTRARGGPAVSAASAWARAWAAYGVAVGCLVSACSAPQTSAKADPGRSLATPAASAGPGSQAHAGKPEAIRPDAPAAAAPAPAGVARGPSNADRAPAVAADTAPDASGWGTAAGLRYLEIVRGQADGREPLPLLVVIHGLGDRPDRKWLQAIDVEPDIRARMILPQAPTPYGRGYAWFEYRFRDRNDAALAQGIRAAEARLSRMIERLRQLRPTRGRAVVCGFSQGGMLSFALSLLDPQRVEFAVAISGELPPQLWPADKPAGWFPKIVALHGKADPVVGFEADRKLVSHLQGLGFAVELLGFEHVRHGISPEMRMRAKHALSAALRGMTATR